MNWILRSRKDTVLYRRSADVASYCKRDEYEQERCFADNDDDNEFVGSTATEAVKAAMNFAETHSEY
ncbi:10069_t:CDS:2 [Ambispora leptoticha]|uniref:10069_t:CDS:1 n=1 Tax=Ambispora leptoticha TaxID=144679 RepID=A0A9N9ANS4_9GLOM|nr:10069_t:CDS:2 [Ambispora leptoticha]